MSNTVFVLLIIAIIAIPVSYAIGLACSHGWHRGKRRFLNQMVKDHCSKENISG